MKSKKIIIAASIIIGVLMSGCSNRENKIQTNENKNKEVVTRTENQKNNKNTKSNNSSVEDCGSNKVSGINIKIYEEESINLNNKIEDSYLEKLSLSDLSLLRNAVYASKGYDFSTKYLKDYFSKYNWYKPLGKDIEDRFSNIDRNNIKSIILQEKSTIHDLKNSRDNRTIIENGVKINGCHSEFELVISSVPYSGEGMTNKPIKLVLEGKENSLEYKSDWNDGVFVKNTDIDESDDSVEVLITAAGTDIVCTTDIYKYINGKLEKQDTIQHFGDNILIGDNGYLYYANAKGNGEFNTIYNYSTKEKEEIWDNIIRNKLSEKNLIRLESNEVNTSQNNKTINKKIVSRITYREDLDYDGDEEEIYVEFAEKEGYSYNRNNYAIKLTHGDKVYTYEEDGKQNLDEYIKFMYMDEKVYFYIYEDGPSGDPCITVLEMTEDGIKEVLIVEGNIKDYTRDGRIYTWYSYLGSDRDVVLHYYDIKKGIIRVEKSEIIGKEISFDGHILLYSVKNPQKICGMSWASEERVEDIRRIKADKDNFSKEKDKIEEIIYVADPGEKFEVVDVDFETHPERLRNIPIKVKNKNGDIGWLLWLNGGD